MRYLDRLCLTILFIPYPDRQLGRPELVAGEKGELEGAARPHPVSGPRGAEAVLRPGQRTRDHAGLMLQLWDGGERWDWDTGYTLSRMRDKNNNSDCLSYANFTRTPCTFALTSHIQEGAHEHIAEARRFLGSNPVGTTLNFRN